MTFLRSQGFRLVIYLDDFLLLNSCKREAEREFLAATEHLEKCGFVINIEKSIGTPHQVIEFLGLIVDSRNLSLSLRTEKVDEIIRLCQNLFSKSSAPLREIAKVLGLFAWAIKAVPFAQSHYRDLQRLYIEGCVRFENNLNSLVLLDSDSKINLSWWVAKLIKCNGKPMLAVDPDLTIYSDASNSGWGGVLNGVSTRGPWTEADRLRHINELELLAALYSLKAFTSQLEGISIRLMMDNSTAVCYVNKAGGTRSKSLNNIAADIMCWCESKKISVHAAPWNIEFSRRSAIQIETGVQRLEAQNVHLFPAVGTVGTGSGFICIPLEPAGGAVYELETPAGIGGVGRFHLELEESERIRVSPVQSDPPMLDQDQERQSGRADGDPSVAVPAVVANDFGVILSTGPHFETERGPVARRDGHQPPTPSARVPPVGRMDLIRRRYEDRGLSEGSGAITPGQQSRNHISYLQKCLERLVPLVL